jgi:hypothetical protein
MTAIASAILLKQLQERGPLRETSLGMPLKSFTRCFEPAGFLAGDQELNGPAVLFLSHISNQMGDQASPELSFGWQNGNSLAGHYKFQFLAESLRSWEEMRETSSKYKNLVYRAEIFPTFGKSLGGYKTTSLVLASAVGIKNSSYFDEDMYTVDGLAISFVQGAYTNGLTPYFYRANYPIFDNTDFSGAFIDEKDDLAKHCLRDRSEIALTK